MSTVTRGALTERTRGGTLLRALALLGALVVMGSYLSAMYFVVDVVGNPTDLLTVVAATLVIATVCSRFVTVRQAVGLSLTLLAGGMVWYLLSLPSHAFALTGHMEYIVALLSGHSVLELVNLKQWVLAVTPAPVFLTWYLALRRHYGLSALVGGATVGFFVLTGDMTFPVALVGSVGTLALVGLGELELADAPLADAEVVSIVLTVVVVTALTVSLVPQGAAMQYSPSSGFGVADGKANTIEANLLSDSATLDIRGSIELSPNVRWTVESRTQEYWRVGAYDLYTGDGWVRRSGTVGLDALEEPPGSSRRITQTYRAASSIGTMPAAWRPVSVSGDAADSATVTGFGSLRPDGQIEGGSTYTVTSQAPVTTGSRLQNAGTDYPEELQERYTQLPDSTPDRVDEKTSILTANAETPYETALTIESWLKNNRDYSLKVDDPGDNTADEFLFEREEGYCVHFATTMAAMLRTQDIPARMVVGYTSGERVDDDTWVVRGYNAHAWVEAYFPEVGWVRFDPTPSGPRELARADALETARQDNESGVDTEATRSSEYTPPEEADSTDGPDRNQPWFDGSSSGIDQPEETDEEAESGSNASSQQQPSRGSDETNGQSGPSALPIEVPTREELVLGLVAVFGVAAVVRRSGASGRLYREVWLRFQPREDPETDIERAYQRLEVLLSAHHRDRDPGETTRQYLAAIDADERAREVGRLRERARYGGSVDQGDADRAVELVDELVAQR